MDHTDEHSGDSRWKTRANWALAGFLAIGGFFLFTEHRAHLLGILPFLFLLSCPLMHLFMHHGHGGHHHDGGGQGQGGPAGRTDERRQDPPGAEDPSK